MTMTSSVFVRQCTQLFINLVHMHEQKQIAPSDPSVWDVSPTPLLGTWPYHICHSEPFVQGWITISIYSDFMCVLVIMQYFYSISIILQ